MPGTVKTLIYQIIWDDGDAKKNADAWDRKLTNTAKLAEIALRSLSNGFKDIIKDSISLEDALSGAKRTANLSEEQISDLTRAVRDLSSEQLRGAVTAQDLGEILEVAGQRGELAGDKFEETLQGALRFTQQIATASQALDLSFQKTADALGKLQGPYGETTVEVGNLANAINVLADSTKAAAPQIIQIAQKAAPALAAFRVGQGDVIGLSAAMDALGVTAYTSSTALQTTFKKMTANTEAFAEAFGMNTKEFNRLVQTDITGALLLLLQHIQKMATETPAGTQKVARALKDLGVAGAGVSTALLGLASLGPELQTKFLDPANEGLTNMDSINKEFINSISRVSQLWKALGTIWTNTIGVLGDMMLPVLREILQEVNEQAIAFRKWFVESKFVEEMFPKALQWIRDKFDELLGRVRAFVKESGGMPGVWEKFQAKVKEVWEIGKPLLTFFIETLPDILKAISSITKATISWGKAISPLLSLLKPVLDMYNAVAEVMWKVVDIASNIVDMFGKMSGAIANKVAPAVQFLSDKMSGLLEKIGLIGEKSHEKSVFPEMVDWLGKVGIATDAVSQKFQDQINLMDQLAFTPGLMTASGVMQAMQNRRSAETQLSRLNMDTPMMMAQQAAAGQPQTLNVTLQMGDQEIGRVHTILKDRDQQEQRRSTGGHTLF
jgi:TP901 family phage tail tape measure protein